MDDGLAPRIAPGTRVEIGVVNFSVARAIGLATGGRPPHVFTTLARHRTLFRRWLPFAAGLMPRGLLPREESELLILRVAHNCGCGYEWLHHDRLGRDAGLSREEVERVRLGPAADGWTQRRALLLAAADELHAERMISTSVWSGLAGLLSEPELIELCLLVGHYEMLAMTLNSLQVAPDTIPLGQPSPAMRVLGLVVGRRRRAAGASR